MSAASKWKECGPSTRPTLISRGGAGITGSRGSARTPLSAGAALPRPAKSHRALPQIPSYSFHLSHNPRTTTKKPPPAYIDFPLNTFYITTEHIKYSIKHHRALCAASLEQKVQCGDTADALTNYRLRAAVGARAAPKTIPLHLHKAFDELGQWFDLTWRTEANLDKPLYYSNKASVEVKKCRLRHTPPLNVEREHSLAIQ
ncbi:hypothetical protein EVAR_57474_1 [Eumeta japonica]|uniref:Uncharacterized protein n=1 Tax=Eumeta variegata TaxID=151549 RepID=A0A4C1ZDZ0_EUMVA|nr:hypothetical protein EVAR_57474_1 [Eumeta japonica]